MSRWIQRALGRRKPGALHRMLGIPAGKKIPLGVLREAAECPEAFYASPAKQRLLARRARLAMTLRRIGKRKRTRRQRK